MQTKKNIFLWALYDFANSLVSIVFFLYFSQWIVIDRGMSDIWFNITLTVSALLLLITVPITGHLLDKYWKRITGLRYSTAFTVLLYGLAAYSALIDLAVPALVFWTLGLYAYLLSFSFYSPLLNDIAPPSKRGRISGYGIAANYAGQLTGLVIALPFATGSLSFFGAAARAETLLPAVCAFLLFSLPVLIWFKEDAKPAIAYHMKDEFKLSLKESRALFTAPGVLLFFIAYFLFNDTVLTAANNFPIFLEQVWAVSDTIKSMILAGILVTSAIGGAAAGHVADRFGNKKTMLAILVGWVIILPLIGLLFNFTLFIIATTLMGFWFGASWSVSRAMIAELAPAGKHNLTFGYFGLVERASSLVGPLVWGGIVSGLVSLGSDRYRIAAAGITVFVVVAIFVLRRVK